VALLQPASGKDISINIKVSEIGQNLNNFIVFHSPVITRALCVAISIIQKIISSRADKNKQPIARIPYLSGDAAKAR
jgi:hypothetical protein